MKKDRLEAILDFWFEGVDDATGIRKKARPFCRWFVSRRTFDDVIRSRFEGDLRLAAAGGLRDWTRTPRGTLGLILLFDQFSRNIYRHTPRMYAYDDQAQGLSRAMVISGRDRDLRLIERIFCYMPLTHAEDAALQLLGLRCFEGLYREAERNYPYNAAYYAWHWRYARKSYEVIQTEGRFRHRDPLRISTRSSQ